MDIILERTAVFLLTELSRQGYEVSATGNRLCISPTPHEQVHRLVEALGQHLQRRLLDQPHEVLEATKIEWLHLPSKHLDRWVLWFSENRPSMSSADELIAELDAHVRTEGFGDYEENHDQLKISYWAFRFYDQFGRLRDWRLFSTKHRRLFQEPKEPHGFGR